MRKDAFIIMPFSSTASCTEPQWSEIFNDVFKPAFTECGYECERAQPMIGSLTESIIERLRNSRIVLADVTDRNPNVFYELGVRHSLRAGTIIVSQKGRDVPSDLRGLWYLAYGVRPADVRVFKGEIARLVKVIEGDSQKSDNPVASFLEKENITLSQVRQGEKIKYLTALYTELTGNVVDLSKESAALPSPTLLTLDALNWFLTSLYIDVGGEMLSRFYKLRHTLRLIQGGFGTDDSIAVAVLESQSLANRVLELRDRILKGEFQEPPRLSTMVWGAQLPIIWGPTGTGKTAFAAALYDQLKNSPGFPEIVVNKGSVGRLCSDAVLPLIKADLQLPSPGHTQKKHSKNKIRKAKSAASAPACPPRTRP